MTTRPLRIGTPRQSKTEVTLSRIAIVFVFRYVIVLAMFFVAASSNGADGDFAKTIQPVLRQYCVGCHSTKQKEGELDLEQFASLQSATDQPMIWEHVLEQLENGEMPPKDEKQIPVELKTQFTTALQDMLDQFALTSAGDPGKVVLRRLSNMEYTHTIRDLTRVASLDPAKEFPIDGAAGEGFTNAGAALVMSPSLLTKYLDAAKNVAKHAVLLPDGIRFSAATSRRDWTNESLHKIREFYRQFTVNMDDKVKVGGTGWVSNDGGRIPLDKYLAAITEHRSALVAGTRTIESIAAESKLNAKYLQQFWAMLTDDRSSLLFDSLRSKWQQGQLTVADIELWQRSLWRFSNIGHIGKAGGPKAWMEPVSPLVHHQEFRLKLSAPADGQDLTLYLAAGDAGDGNEHDFALWERARIVRPGTPDLPLKELRSRIGQMVKRRAVIVETAPECLAAANEAQHSTEQIDLNSLAQKHNVDPDILAAWLTHLGINTSSEVKLDNLLTAKLESVANYNFIQGWSGEQAYSVLANSSDATVLIPGTIKPYSLATHPSPQLASVIAWRSPIAANVTIAGSVQDAHTRCGNGVTGH